MSNWTPAMIKRAPAQYERMTDHKPLSQADIGRVYVHGTSVRVVLINHLGDEPFQVTIKCMEPTPDGEYIVTQVDSRNLAATGEWVPGVQPVRLSLTPEQAALLHSMLRESGWGYTEAGVPEVAAAVLELAAVVCAAQEQVSADKVRPAYADMLFDAQFEGVSDRKMITGEDDRDTDCSCWATSRNGCPKHTVTK